jgi:hypothetical protein
MKKFICLFIINMPIIITAQQDQSHNIQVQGTFFSHKYYPAIVFEKFINNDRDAIKITVGSALASKKYYTKDYFYDTIKHSATYSKYFELPYGGTFHYNYPEYGKESKSLYTGFLIKGSYLIKFYYKIKKNKYFRISGGLDVGLYLLKDNYNLAIENQLTKQQRNIKNSFNSKAVSCGGIIDFKKSISRNWYVSSFTQAMFYFDNWPNKSFIYAGTAPFFGWEIESGIGIGYTFYK